MSTELHTTTPQRTRRQMRAVQHSRIEALTPTVDSANRDCRYLLRIMSVICRLGR